METSQKRRTPRSKAPPTSSRNLGSNLQPQLPLDAGLFAASQHRQVERIPQSVKIEGSGE